MCLAIHVDAIAYVEVFSDKKYWQVADQPGKEDPKYLVMVDLEGKEVKKCLTSLNEKQNAV